MKITDRLSETRIVSLRAICVLGAFAGRRGNADTCRTKTRWRARLIGVARKTFDVFMSDNTVYARVVCAGISIVRWKGSSCAAGKVKFVELACVIERAGITVVTGDVSKEARSAA